MVGFSLFYFFRKRCFCIRVEKSGVFRGMAIQFSPCNRLPKLMIFHFDSYNSLTSIARERGISQWTCWPSEICMSDSG